jgi:FdhD protein
MRRDLGKGYLSARSLLSVSSCGICGKQELNDVMPNENAIENSEDRFEIGSVLRMHKKLFDNQKLFIETGGCHGVAAFDKDENLLSLHEDIGRHNALGQSNRRITFYKKIRRCQSDCL